MRTLLLSIILFSVASVSAQSESWHQYVLGPQSWTVLPKAILSVNGNVSNPEALLTQIGTATFSRKEGEDPPAVVLDFGINVVGILNINFTGASNGLSQPGIRLSFSEALMYLGDISDYSRSTMPGAPSPITPGSDQIAVQPEPYIWTASYGCQNGTKVCSDGLHGFRYMKIYLDAIETDFPITQPFGTVNISGLYLQYSAFLGTIDTYQGWFECSDKELTKYWYGAVYTTDMATDIFRETDCDPRDAASDGLEGKLVLHDGAKRDRNPYIGDVAVSFLTTFLAHGNLSSDAAKNVIADLGNHQREDGFIPSSSLWNYQLYLFDYPLWWILSLYEYTIYMGDLDFLREYYPNLQRNLNGYYPTTTNGNSTLISKPSGYGDYAGLDRDGEASYYNTMYVLSLKRAAELAYWLQDEENRQEWLKRADLVAQEINERFWDEKVGAYTNTNTSILHPQDANAMAILAGVASADQARMSLQYLANITSRPYGNAFLDGESNLYESPDRVYAFISVFDIRARFLSGEIESAMDEIRRLYGWMYYQDPQYTYWEGVGKDGTMYQGPYTSAAHGWSTGVSSILTNFILGVDFISPGGNAWVFSPYETDVEWAAGQIPRYKLPPITVMYVNNQTEVIMEVTAPEGTVGRVRIPTTKNVTVLLNNELVWSQGKALVDNIYREAKGNVVIDKIGQGHHIIKANKMYNLL